ncbi:MAG: serine hydrolase domain-containing protein [Planctomycetota bacterium]|nr:serine hydrolase domain-containing protein [Planctomycetota bacterium]
MFFACCTAVAQEPAPLPAEMAAAVEAAQESRGIPGISVAVALDGRLAYAEARGFIDLENKVPATWQSVYRLASISKVVTAVAVLQLVEQGKLDLDTPVGAYLDEWPEKRWPVTARQLLCHQAGVRHYKPGEGESTRHSRTQRAGLVRFRADPLLHEPGSKYLYSSFGFNLAAALVEVGSGQSFADYVAVAIAKPAGAETLQDDNVRRLIPHRAQGYIRRDGVLENSELMDGSYKLGGGGLCSNAVDLARFGIALLDGRLLSKKSLSAMTVGQVTTQGDSTNYGLGILVGGDSQKPQWWHGGAQSRVSSVMLLEPESSLVVVVLCNLERVRPLFLARQLAELAKGV